MQRRFGSNARLVPFLCLLVAVFALPALAQPTKGGDAGDGEALTNPLLGDAEAIEEGEKIFRRRCVGCHWSPKRGPDLFKTEISDEKFLMTVINGRTGGRAPMPAFGYVLSPDDVWKVHAFVTARDRP
jgi:mono/diheme cytochrome c family protein